MPTVTSVGDNKQQQFMQGTGKAGELDKHAFLGLLITQLRYQDPMNPKDNGEFLAQMAQFTSLEQVQNINAGMDKLLSNQTGHNKQLLEKIDKLNTSLEGLLNLNQSPGFAPLGQELYLLGKEVTIKMSNGEEITGIVDAVTFGSELGKLVIDGQEYNYTQLLKVSGVSKDE